MRKFLSFSSIISFIILLCTPILVHAQTATTNVASQVGTAVPSSKSASSTARLDYLQTRCNSEIDTRLTSLNNAIAKIGGVQKLSDSQKQQYESSLQQTINGLTDLKAQCASDTTAKTVAVNTKSVFSGYRVYAELLPQTSLLVAADKLGTTAGQLNDLSVKLQTRITNAQSQGQTVSSMQTLLTDMQTQITNAQTQSTTIIGLVSPLQPTTYDQNPSGTKTTFTTAKSDLQAGMQDLRKAIQDAEQIRNILVSMGKTKTTTGSSSAATIPTVSVTASPSTTPGQ